MRPLDVLEPGSAYVFKLGPFGEEGEWQSAYLAVTVDGEPVPPLVTRGDARALAQLAPQLAGRRVACEPRLARAAARHGFTPTPMPGPLLALRAGLALAALWEPGLVDPRAALVGPLLEASVGLWSQAPWKHWSDEQPFVVHVEGGLPGPREGALLGHGSHEFGFALYDHPGTVARVARLMAAGRATDAEHQPALALTFESEPAWARAAVKAATGLPRFPLPLRVDEDGLGALGPSELVLLTATARALSGVGPELREVSGYASFEAIRLTVHLELPAPAPTPARRARLARRPHLREVEPEPEEPGAEGTDGRISQALVRFARPLLELLDAEVEEDELTELLLFALAVWNAVVREDAGEDPSAVDSLRRHLASPGAGDFLLGQLEQLVRRKRRLFPEDLRVLETLEVSRRKDGQLGVRVLARHAVPGLQPQAP